MSNSRFDGTAHPVAELARRDVRDLPLYTADQELCPIDLSDNTNLWGPCPAALRVVREAAGSELSRYPCLYSESLHGALRRYVGVEEAGVVLGCGSDDVLDAVMRTFGGRNGSIAFCAPTFSMIPTFARLNGLRTMPVPMRDDFDIDPERLVASDADIVYICAPNNPTATPVSRAAIEFVVAHASGVVVIDEAYAEFATATHADLVTHSDRLLVTRTFSKAFGLAGLRVGYGAGSSGLVSLLERARGPYKVNALAERAVRAVLGDEADALPWVRSHAQLACATRARLIASLREIGADALPSDANFVFVPTARAGYLSARLRACGIRVRVHQGLAADTRRLAAARGQGLRIGVGPWDMLQPLLDVLSSCSGELAS